MFKALRMGFAFAGTIIGAGFASGQEILQYFTSFGIYGALGAFVATCLFAYIGMMLAKMGSRVHAYSHDHAIYQLSGRYVGRIIDYILIFTFFGVGVVMIAGAGSMISQEYQLPAWIGRLIITILTFMTIISPINRIITIIGAITPFLIVALVIVAIYSLFTPHAQLSELDTIAQTTKTSLPNWFISAINYVSFNIAFGAGMVLVMGGSEPNEKIASWGGFIGGLGVGILIFIAYFTIFFQIETVKDVGLPLLKIVQDISPILGIIMTIILFGMIYSTSVAMFYAFVARFTKNSTKSRFSLYSIIALSAAFILSFLGFTKLVAYFYPLIGYLGILLIIILLIAPFKLRKQENI